MSSMVGTDFGSAEGARFAANAVRIERGLETSGLRIIRPADPQIDRKLEPESHSIAGTLVRAHLMLGVAGLLVGLVLSLLLVANDVQPFAASPVASISMVTAFSVVAGLLAGGLFSLRPDHDAIIHRAMSVARSGRWFVVVHTRRPEQQQRAFRLLRSFNRDTLRTF